MSHRYKISEGPDGIFWVSIQPLLMDIQDQLQSPELPEVAVHPLECVESFLKALLQEGSINKYVQQSTTQSNT